MHERAYDPAAIQRALGVVLSVMISAPVVAQETPDTGAASPPDTTRYVQVVEGRTIGSWLTWREGPRTRGYADRRFDHFPRTEHLELDASGLPVRLEATGQIGDGVPSPGTASELRLGELDAPVTASSTEARRHLADARASPAEERSGLRWIACPFDRRTVEEAEGLRVRCGELAVPESWERPGDRRLTIAFTVAEPEGGATGEPVVLMPGGPGVTVVPRGLRLLRRWGVGDRTLVVFDARGTGHSGPLMCTGLSITESDVASMDLTLEEARTLERGAYLACRDELLNRGVDLRAYRSSTVARDVRALRRALGYERWNMLGNSYGVTLGRSVFRADSDGVRSATFLVGPHPDPEMLVTRDVPNFARALELFFDLCVGDPVCASRHPRLEEDLYTTYEELQAEPWTVPVDRKRFRRSTFTVNAQDFIRLVYGTLGSDGDLPRLPGLIRAFRDRDEAAAVAVLEDEHGGLSSTFSTGLMYAVDCNDAYTPRSRAEREAAAAGHPAALDDIRYFLAPCPDWPDPGASERERAPVESEVPALVVTAEMDPMNPPVTGEEQLRYLENGHHFVVPDASHGFSFNPRTAPCVAELVSQFLDDPGQRPDDACLDELGPRRLVPEDEGR